MSVDASAVARVLGITVEHVNLRQGNAVNLPQRIAVIAQGATASAANYATTKFAATGAGAVGAQVGYGSPADLIVEQLLPSNGDGVGTIPVTVYPLKDAVGAVAAAGDITPSGTAAKAVNAWVRIGGKLSAPFVVPAGAVVVADQIAAMITAINGVLRMPFVASDGTTTLDLTCKWKGTTGNGVPVEVIESEPSGVVWTITQPTGGLTDPTVDDALAQIGATWETIIITALADDTTLDTIQTFGEGRWGTLAHKPLVAFYGNTEADVSTATTATASRTDDRVSCQLVAPGSVNLPCVVAARQVARIAKTANNIPAHDYGGQRADGIIPGTDGEQWDYASQDLAVKAGSSTVDVVDGVVYIGDVVTSYAPDGEDPPAYRYVCDIVKLQNIVYNTRLIFAAPEWNGAPLVPDDQDVVEATAKQPRNAIAEVAALIDDLASKAIISNPAAAKASIVCAVDGANPKRWNLTYTVQLSGNSNVRDVTLKFGFYFG